MTNQWITSMKRKKEVNSDRRHSDKEPHDSTMPLKFRLKWFTLWVWPWASWISRSCKQQMEQNSLFRTSTGTEMTTIKRRPCVCNQYNYRHHTHHNSLPHSNFQHYHAHHHHAHHSRLSSQPNYLLSLLALSMLALIWTTPVVIASPEPEPNPNPDPNPNPAPHPLSSKLSLREWEDIFQSRSPDDWRQLWHHEKHRRCHHQLMSHMAMVCDKDIYKIARKRKRSTQSQEAPSGDDYFNYNKNEYIFEPGPNHPLFVSYKDANRFGIRRVLGKKRSGSIAPITESSTNGALVDQAQDPAYPRLTTSVSKRAITDECCDGADGCSWEEYAEYCPANVRIRS